MNGHSRSKTPVFVNVYDLSPINDIFYCIN